MTSSPAESAELAPLADDDIGNAPSVQHDMEIANAIHPAVLVARHFVHAQASDRSADVHQGLDLEASTIQCQRVQMPSPKSVVAIAQIGVPGAEQVVDKRSEELVPEPTRPRQVIAPTAAREPGSLDEVGSRDQGCHVAEDLASVLWNHRRP